MISTAELQKLATLYQISEFPNVAREYIQHVFLSHLSSFDGAPNMLFKGGTALRILFGSPRFSEDLDFDLVQVPAAEKKSFVEYMFSKVLAEMEKTGFHVTLGAKPGPTIDGYFGDASFRFLEYAPITLEINVSSRKSGTAEGEMDTVPNDYIPPYNVYHLKQEALVSEKIFGALLDRKKPRDFYDFYFLMRKGFLSADQKKRLAPKLNNLRSVAENIDFKSELSTFLPANHQAILKDFGLTLLREIKNQFGSL